MGFWFFFTDIKKMIGKLVHVTISDYLIITFFISLSSQVDLYCIISEKYNKPIPEMGTDTMWNTYFTDPSKNPLGKKNRLNFKYTYDSTTVSWYYVRCGMSVQLLKAFFYGQQKNNKSFPLITEITLLLENIKWDQTNDANTEKTDYLLRHNYNTSDKLTLSIKQAQGVNSSNKNKLYIKNLYIFQDYLKDNVELQYYSIHKFITLNTDYPELLYGIGFDNMASASTGNWSTEGWDFTTSPPTKITTKMAANGSFTNKEHITIDAAIEKDAYYFRRLEIIETANQKYDKKSLSSLTASTKAASQYYVYEDNKAMSCNDSNYLGKDLC